LPCQFLEAALAGLLLVLRKLRTFLVTVCGKLSTKRMYWGTLK